MRAMKKILFLILINALSVSAAERIVSLSPALTELVCHLGCEKQLIGRSDVCNFPESVREIPVAGLPRSDSGLAKPQRSHFPIP